MKSAATEPTNNQRAAPSSDRPWTMAAMRVPRAAAWNATATAMAARRSPTVATRLMLFGAVDSRRRSSSLKVKGLADRLMAGRQRRGGVSTARWPQPTAGPQAAPEVGTTELAQG